MRFEGQVAVFDARRGPCYRCLFPEPPPPELAPNCAEAGVLGVLPGVIGVLQATEVLKLLLGAGEPLIGRLLVYDALAMEFQTFRVPKDPDCAVCGERPTITAPIDYATFCAAQATSRAGRAGDLAAPAARAARRWRGAALDRRAGALGSRACPHRRRAARAAGAAGGAAQRSSRRWRDRDVVVHCQMGGRSRRACELLRSKGFRSVSNLAGGIEAWAREVDPEVSR